MEKIKHIVATRFLCFEGILGESVLSKEALKMGLEKMANYLVPSLENQTVKDFEFVVLVHPKLNLGIYKRRIMALSDKLNIKIVRVGEFDEYAKSCLSEAENVIITRIDYDDLVWNGAVEDTQKRVGKSPLYIYGYNKGYAWKEGSDDIRDFYRDYHDHGNMSIFQSCILDSASGLFFQPYRWNHTRPQDFLVDIDKEKIQFEMNKEINAFIWVRHENSQSGVIFPAYVKDKVDVSKDEIKRIFGAEILK